MLHTIGCYVLLLITRVDFINQAYNNANGVVFTFNGTRIPISKTPVIIRESSEPREHRITYLWLPVSPDL